MGEGTGPVRGPGEYPPVDGWSMEGARKAPSWSRPLVKQRWGPGVKSRSMGSPEWSGEGSFLVECRGETPARDAPTEWVPPSFMRHGLYRTDGEQAEDATGLPEGPLPRWRGITAHILHTNLCHLNEVLTPAIQRLRNTRTKGDHATNTGGIFQNKP